MRKIIHRRSKKAGMPPGTLMHIGTVQVDKPTLTLFRYHKDFCEEKRLSSLNELPEQQSGDIFWLNIHGVHDSDLLKTVGERFSIHPLILEDILSTQQRPKVEQYPDRLFITTRIFAYDPTRNELHSDQVSLLLGDHFVLSFQEKPTGIFEPIRERLRAGRGKIREVGADYLAYALLDATVDAYFDLIETFAERSETMEESLLGKANSALLPAIHQIKRHVVELRRTVWQMREMLGTLQRGDVQGFKSSTRLYLRDVYDHSVHLLESLDTQRDLLSSLQEIYLSSISNRVNLEVRALTVVTTLFMPASLIAGIFGMNFKQMPWLEDSTGFWFSIALMLSIACVMLILFWRRQLIR